MLAGHYRERHRACWLPRRRTCAHVPLRASAHVAVRRWWSPEEHMEKHIACVMRVAGAAALASVLSIQGSAQWVDYRNPAIPRKADGAPELTKPTPRTA